MIVHHQRPITIHLKFYYHLISVIKDPMTSFDFQKLFSYLTNTFSKKNYLYQTNPSLRLSSMYWTVLSLKILENYKPDPGCTENSCDGQIDKHNCKKNEKFGKNNFDTSTSTYIQNKIFEEAFEFLQCCKNPDGGYAGNVGYPSTLFTTYVGLQLRFLLGKQEYDTKTLGFIKSCYRNGMFFNDAYDEEDCRFVCCGLTSLYFLYLSKNSDGNVQINEDCFLRDRGCCSYQSYSRNYKSSSKDGENTATNNNFVPGNDIKNSSKTITNDSISSKNFISNSNYPADSNSITIVDCFSNGNASTTDNTFSLFLTKEGFIIKEIISYIFKCYNRDGGFGSKPGNESHAGYIYCCITSLSLLNMLHLLDFQKTSKFIALRHNFGLNGRPNKKDDVCYSYWALSVFKILNIPIDEDLLKDFISKCFNGEGFSYLPDNDADLYHTCYALMGLSLLENKGFKKIIAELGVTYDQ